jgi:hypothetical protein
MEKSKVVLGFVMFATVVGFITYFATILYYVVI